MHAHISKIKVPEPYLSFTSPKRMWRFRLLSHMTLPKMLHIVFWWLLLDIVDFCTAKILDKKILSWLGLFILNGSQVNGGGCSTASFLEVWYFHILPITYIIIQKNFKTRHARPVTKGPKSRCYTPPTPLPPLNEGLAAFGPTSPTYQTSVLQTGL